MGVLDEVRQVLLPDPVVGVAVGVAVALLPLLPGGIGVDVLKLTGEDAQLSLAHVRQGGVDGHAAGVGLGRGGKEDHRVGQREPCLWHPEL